MNNWTKSTAMGQKMKCHMMRGAKKNEFRCRACTCAYPCFRALAVVAISRKCPSLRVDAIATPII